MKFCVKCGAQLPDEAVFCDKCGTPQPAAQPGGPAPGSQPGPQSGYQAGPPPGYQQGPSVNYADPIADANANKVYGILAYIGILVLVSIFAAPKESRYSRFHANQGLVLAIVDFGLAIVFGIISGILTAILASQWLWSVVAIINGIIWLVYAAAIIPLVIIGIVNAAKGEQKPLPVIGKFTILK